MKAFAGRYVLIDLVGTGGMGSVWRAWDLRRESYVAAKVLGQHDASTLLRFVREQSLRIEHPHVVAPHGWAADDDKVVFAMDLVRGGSVATLLGDHGPLPASYVAALIDQLLHGLSAVHAAGIVHRDLKPANLLLDATGTGYPHLRLSDFGIAGLLDEPRMTRHSTVLGTPGYLAPEQLTGADPDPRQDLYTVGAVAAELLTGNRPDVNGKLPEPEGGGLAAADGPNDDGPLWDLIRHLAAELPNDRPASAAAAGRLLAATNLIPAPGSTSWTTHGDPPEVFDQLPPLPPTWTPTGPVLADPAPAGSAPTGPAPTASPAGLTSGATVLPLGGAPGGAGVGLPGGRAGGAGVAPSGGGADGAGIASPGGAVGSAGAASPGGAAGGAGVLSPRGGAGDEAVGHPVLAAGEADVSTVAATREVASVGAGPAVRRVRPLAWLAVGSFGGAAALLGAAAWLLQR